MDNINLDLVAKSYINLIKAGKISLEQVPAHIRSLVESKMK